MVGSTSWGEPDQDADEVAGAHQPEGGGRLDGVPDDLVGACRAWPSRAGRMPQAIASCRAVRSYGRHGEDRAGRAGTG